MGKNYAFAWWANQRPLPRWGKRNSLPFLPVTTFSPTQTLEGLYELTWLSSRVLDSPHKLLLELQKIKDTVKCAMLGAKVPGHHQE